MSFEPFRSLVGPAAALLGPNIDTDVIIRVDHLTKQRHEVAPFAFEALRYRPDGTLDPSFPLNQPTFRHAPILLTGPNFGCGSSREPAVWAIAGLGVRCIIGSSFGDIFFANCAQNGVLVVSLPADTVADLARRCADGTPLAVDLERQIISLAAEPTATAQLVVGFAITASAKQSLLEGLDDVELALLDDEVIGDFQRRDRVERPWAWPSQR
jgi:3-isopropylmalate/(R)-2-methylmalate dehydratase small subunit